MIGQTVQNFSLKDQSGNVFDLYESLDKRVLLVFYPKDNSPVCSRQLSNYTKNEKSFEENDIKIVGINSGSAGDHKNFCDKIGIDFPLLVDEEKKVCRQFKAINIFGAVKRKLVLINTNKKIIYEKDVFPLFYLNSDFILHHLKNDSLLRNSE